MARLQGFFDESGMHQDATITTVAGFIATENQWNSFNPKWKRALEKQKIKVFHMVDFEKGRGDFRGWTVDRKIDLIKKLLEIIVECANLIVAHAVKPTDFQKIKKEYPKANISRYQLCCDQCIVSVSTWLMRNPERGDSVGIIFEQGNKFMSETMNLYLEASMSQFLRNKYHIDSIMPGRKEDFPALQAADILAYETYRFHDTRVRDENTPLREVLRSLIYATPHRGWMNNPGTIKMSFDIILHNRQMLKRQPPSIE